MNGMTHRPIYQMALAIVISDNSLRTAKKRSLRSNAMISLNFKYLVVAGILALSLNLFGCGEEHHTTEVQLPNGVTCKSETGGTFLSPTRDMSCTDSNGKVVGSYKSD